MALRRVFFWLLAFGLWLLAVSFWVLAIWLLAIITAGSRIRSIYAGFYRASALDSPASQPVDQAICKL